MLGPEDVLRLTSHAVGGVCPFGLPAPLTIYCDVSLKIYDEVIPAGGSTHASVGCLWRGWRSSAATAGPMPATCQTNYPTAERMNASACLN